MFTALFSLPTFRRNAGRASIPSLHFRQAGSVKRKDEYSVDEILGIVSNGQDWQFYKLTTGNEIYETAIYPMTNLSELLGVLDTICSECAKNVP